MVRYCQYIYNLRGEIYMRIYLNSLKDKIIS